MKNNYLIIHLFGFAYLVRHDGKKTTEEIEEAFMNYEGQPDTDEQMIENILADMDIDFEILPCRQIAID